MKIKHWVHERRFLKIVVEVEEMLQKKELKKIISFKITETEKHGINAILIYK